MTLQNPLTLSQIVEQVASKYQLKIADIMQHSRKEHLVFARWESWRIMKSEGYGVRVIADYFGVTYHAVDYALQQTKERTTKRQCLMKDIMPHATDTSPNN